MSPMRSTQYFQPMVTAPLGKVDNFRYLKSSSKGHVAIIKPAGLDVFIYNGRMFDFFNREIINKEVLEVTFPKILKASISSGGCFHGVLTLKGGKIEEVFHLLYSSVGSISNLHYHAYDIAFPHFKSDEMQYWTRYDICTHLLKNDKPNCSMLLQYPVVSIDELNQLVTYNFDYPSIQSVLIFDQEGRYMPGTSQ